MLQHVVKYTFSGRQAIFENLFQLINLIVFIIGLIGYVPILCFEFMDINVLDTLIDKVNITHFMTFYTVVFTLLIFLSGFALWGSILKKSGILLIYLAMVTIIFLITACITVAILVDRDLLGGFFPRMLTLTDGG